MFNSAVSSLVMQGAVRLAGSLCLLGLLPSCALAEVTLHFIPPNNTDSLGYIEARGIDPDHLKIPLDSGLTDASWSQSIQVRVVRPDGDVADQAMLGRVSILAETLRFVPRFGWRPGVRYRANFVTDNLSQQDFVRQLGGDVELEFVVPALSPKADVVVEAVYPSSNVLPENLLRFYIHFSEPMSRGESYKHVRLLDESGKPIADPFLELGEELWDRSGMRFTLLFDPGRVKRGLKPREDVGPVLECDKQYTLVIRSTWRDATGNPLKETYRKVFRVSPADDSQPDIERWQLKVPKVDSRGSIVVDFRKPLDRALLNRLISVKRDTEVLAGSVRITDNERVWEFQPDQPWQSGRYRLVADTRLEDPAGNSLGRPFEVDMAHPTSSTNVLKTVGREFEIPAPKTAVGN